MNMTKAGDTCARNNDKAAEIFQYTELGNVSFSLAVRIEDDLPTWLPSFPHFFMTLEYAEARGYTFMRLSSFHLE
jgi:hypothetical protein